MARIAKVAGLLIAHVCFAHALTKSTACAEISEIYAKWHQSGGPPVCISHGRVHTNQVDRYGLAGGVAR